MSSQQRRERARAQVGACERARTRWHFGSCRAMPSCANFCRTTKTAKSKLRQAKTVLSVLCGILGAQLDTTDKSHDRARVLRVTQGTSKSCRIVADASPDERCGRRALLAHVSW
eukprot:12398304-Alexandrium_andersonii.AAC.1